MERIWLICLVSSTDKITVVPGSIKLKSRSIALTLIPVGAVGDWVDFLTNFCMIDKLGEDLNVSGQRLGSLIASDASFIIIFLNLNFAILKVLLRFIAASLVVSFFELNARTHSGTLRCADDLRNEAEVEFLT